MSFLNSVLNSIGTGGSIPSTVEPRVVVAKKSDSSLNVSRKRKAEDELDRDVEKPAKVERIGTPKPVDRPIKSPQPSKSNGTPSTSPPTVTVTPATSNKNPKKGSFAAIMARAKETQADTTKITGTIMHKPKEKSRSRKEIIMEREEAKRAAKRGVPLNRLQSSRDSSIRGDGRRTTPEPKAASAAKVGSQGSGKPTERSGYQGTVRPSSTSTSYAGTAKPGYSGTAARGRQTTTSVSSRNTLGERRRVAYDDSDDYGSDDENDYESDDLSDMDAGFDDMEEEEVAAERIARKEDAAAQAELDRLKREKEKKKAAYSKGR